MRKDNTIKAFFALVQGGLWERNVFLQQYGDIDYVEIMRFAEEQSMVGLVTAGLEHVKDIKVPQEILLQFIDETLQLEQTNIEMNDFIKVLVERMRNCDIYTLVVKGQGVAQCYEKPLWRACGDVDLYLSDTNFENAKLFFRPLVDSFNPDNATAKHINMHFGQWVVEIHENQYCSLSNRVNRVMEEIHKDIFYSGNVRSWNNKGTLVFLPSVENDILIVFTHFLNHFYKGGVGVRQICDWCRLMYKYRESIDRTLLEKRLKKMGLINVWKAFAAFAIDYLGMPTETMPFYSQEKRWRRKGNRICSFILEVGNFGHNRYSNYYNIHSKILRKLASFGRRCGDMLRHTKIFPWETFRFFPNMVYNGVLAYLKGE